MGYRISKVYTRTGDQGTTAMADGQRLSKSHPRIEAIGELDELNSRLGMLVAMLRERQLDEVADQLEPYQHLLFDLGGELSMPEYQVVQQQHVVALEQHLDRWNADLAPLQDFILPGGSVLIAQSHLCRCAARSAERRCQQPNEQQALRSQVLAYINRLSDLFFVAARYIARQEQTPEVLWQATAK